MASKMFKALKDPWSTFWDPIRNSFREFGITCAGLLVAYYIGLAAFRLLGCFIKCGALPASMGWKGRIASAALPGGAQFALSTGHTIFQHLCGQCGCEDPNDNDAPPGGSPDKSKVTYRKYSGPGEGQDRTTPEGSEPRGRVGEEGPRRLTNEQKRFLDPHPPERQEERPPMQQALAMADGDLKVAKEEEPAVYAAVVASRVRQLKRMSNIYRPNYPNIEEELDAAQETAQTMERLCAPLNQRSTSKDGKDSET